MDQVFIRKNQYDPDRIDPIQLSRTEAISEMNERFKMMGWQSYGQEDLDKVVTGQKGDTAMDTLARTVISDQMVKMTLISADQAKLMEKHFPEIDRKAKEQMKTLEDQSKISGMEKVKKDFFGKQRKAARAKLKEIEDQKREYDAKLIESERAHFAELAGKHTGEIEKRKNELNEKIANEKDAEKKASYEKCLSALNKTISVGQADTERDLNNKLTNGSEYEFKNAYLMERAKKRLPPSDTRDRISRDISRFAMPLEIHTRDASVLFEVDKNGLTEEERKFDYDKKVDDVVKLADDINVVLKGEHLKPVNGDAPKDAVPAPIDQTQSVKRIVSVLDSRVDQIRKFEDLFQDLFVENPSIHTVVAANTDIKAAYNMLQVSELLSNVVMKSEAFKNLSKEERENAGKTFVYIKVMRELTQALDVWNMNYQNWLKNPREGMPKLTENFDAISERCVKDMTSKLAKI